MVDPRAQPTGTDDRSGELLDGRYRLERKLAEGGMGAVYLAEHEEIGGKFAVKLLRSELAGSVLLFKRFRRETRATAAIRHRNIVKVFDAGVAPWGEPYMVMEYLEGESLRALMTRSGPLPLGFALEIARQVLEGLGVAHEAGIVHRDLKPDNLFLVHEGGEAPTVKIIDFGISRFAPDQDAHLTLSGMAIGTARYMSPEQAEGREGIDGRADLYSIGVVLYHLLTGAFPHGGANRSEILALLLREPPTPPAEHCPGFPDDVSEVLMRALERDPDCRYRDAAEMAGALAGLAPSGACAEREAPVAGAEELEVVAGDIGDPARTLPARRAARPPRRERERRVPSRAVVREWVSFRGGRWSRRRRIAALILAVGLVPAGIGVAAFLASGRLPRSGTGGAAPVVLLPPPPLAPSAGPAAGEVQPAVVPEGVLLTVEGVPDGGRVLWDGGPAPARRRGTGRGTVMDHGAASAGKARALAGQQLVIAMNKGQLKACYDRALARREVPADADLLVHFRLRLDPGGRVEGADLTGSGASVPPFSECLEREVRSWSFPPEGGGTVVSFSFGFTTAG